MIDRGDLGTKKKFGVSSTLFVFGSVSRSIVRSFVRFFVFCFIICYSFQATTYVVVGFVLMEKQKKFCIFSS